MIRVQAEGFSPGALMDDVQRRAGPAGAVATFTGAVRADDGLVAMTLEHYPGMTERQLAALEAEARRRWPLLDVVILHRFGRLLPGEPIVFVAATAAHRAAAFAACQFLMDWLKTRAPFWKLEERADGQTWVAAKASDDAAAARWGDRDDDAPSA
jgi:molybdopterin synthase catalytic subunit